MESAENAEAARLAWAAGYTEVTLQDPGKSGTVTSWVGPIKVTRVGTAPSAQMHVMVSPGVAMGGFVIPHVIHVAKGAPVHVSKTHTTSSHKTKCGLCSSSGHTTSHHKCSNCGGLGHRGRKCPSKGGGGYKRSSNSSGHRGSSSRSSKDGHVGSRSKSSHKSSKSGHGWSSASGSPTVTLAGGKLARFGMPLRR